MSRPAERGVSAFVVEHPLQKVHARAGNRCAFDPAGRRVVACPVGGGGGNDCRSDCGGRGRLDCGAGGSAAGTVSHRSPKERAGK